MLHCSTLTANSSVFVVCLCVFACTVYSFPLGSPHVNSKTDGADEQKAVACNQQDASAAELEMAFVSCQT